MATCTNCEVTGDRVSTHDILCPALANRNVTADLSTKANANAYYGLKINSAEHSVAGCWNAGNVISSGASCDRPRNSSAAAAQFDDP